MATDMPLCVSGRRQPTDWNPGSCDRSAGARRRTARGTDREDQALGKLHLSDRRAGVRESRKSERIGRVRISAERRRRACRAVQRRLQFTGEIVVLERSGDEEYRIEGETDEP